MSFRVCIGQDKRQPQAHQVAKFSLTRRPSIPIFVAPIKVDDLRALRDQDPHASTEFIYSRFRVVRWKQAAAAIKLRQPTCDLVLFQRPRSTSRSPAARGCR
jgi:hypothetical protein